MKTRHEITRHDQEGDSVTLEVLITMSFKPQFIVNINGTTVNFYAFDIALEKFNELKTRLIQQLEKEKEDSKSVYSSSLFILGTIQENVMLKAELEKHSEAIKCYRAEAPTGKFIIALAKNKQNATSLVLLKSTYFRKHSFKVREIKSEEIL